MWRKEGPRGTWTNFTRAYELSLQHVSPGIELSTNKRASGDILWTGLAILIQGGHFFFVGEARRPVSGNGAFSEKYWVERMALKHGLSSTLLPIKSSLSYFEACSHWVVDAADRLLHRCEQRPQNTGLEGLQYVDLNAINKTVDMREGGDSALVESKSVSRCGIFDSVVEVKVDLHWEGFGRRPGPYNVRKYEGCKFLFVNGCFAEK